MDDQVDTEISSNTERLKFIRREKSLIDDTYKCKGAGVSPNCDEEKFIISIINNNHNPKLESFIRNFFAIIEFDSRRKGKNITRNEFKWYTKTLGKAVTDGIEYFMGKSDKSQNSPHHYKAAIASHITHILRDFYEDSEQGYFNKPIEDTEKTDTEWVKSQVEIAERYFLEGKKYIRSLPDFRVKLVALWYCNRFEWIINAIKNDNYNLRKNYFHKKHFSSLISHIFTVVSLGFRHYIKI